MSKIVNKACRNPAEESESDYKEDNSFNKDESSHDNSKNFNDKMLSKRKRVNIYESKHRCPECKWKDFRADNLKRHIKSEHEKLFNAWPTYTDKDWVNYCSQMSS